MATQPLTTAPALLRAYRKARAAGWPARHALDSARTALDWATLNGWTCPADGEFDARRVWPGSYGPVRLRLVADDTPFEPGGYSDKRCAAQEEERARAEGVFLLVAEYWNELAEEWQYADRVGGFIGADWRGSGYDDDLMRAAIDAYRAHKCA